MLRDGEAVTPEHRATLAQLLTAIDAGPLGLAGYAYPERCAEAAAALRAVLAEPEAGEGGAWESAEDFAFRHGSAMVRERDNDIADRINIIFSTVDVSDPAPVLTLIRDLRGLPR